MELTAQEKQAILEQRLKQFAGEKFNHEINKTILSGQVKDATGDAKTELEGEIAKTDEAIAIIDKAIASTQEIASELPVADQTVVS